MTKLRFIRTKPELVYIGRRRTTSFDENDALVNINGKYNASNKRGNSKYPNGVTFLTDPVYCFLYP